MTRHDCGTEHADDREQIRCTYQRLILANLQTEAAALDQPPTAAQVADLWAHAREMSDDGSAAARWVLVVLGLGWRPGVGS